MRVFSEYHPLTIFVHFISFVMIAMFLPNPILLTVALVGSILFYILVFGKVKYKTVMFWILLFVGITVINPLFSHNGITVLFFLNGYAVTFEAVLYGINNALMMLSVFIGFLSFSEIMTADKVMYLFGKISPKLAVLLSLSLRYVPLLKRQARKINNTQHTLGMYKENNIIDSVKSLTNVFSSLTTWSIEMSVDTANSFYARGGELKGRKSFSFFKMTKTDFILIGVSIFLLGIILLVQSSGKLNVEFYPSFVLNENDVLCFVAYFSYFLLVMLPSVCSISGKIRRKRVALWNS